MNAQTLSMNSFITESRSKSTCLNHSSYAVWCGVWCSVVWYGEVGGLCGMLLWEGCVVVLLLRESCVVWCLLVV